MLVHVQRAAELRERIVQSRTHTALQLRYVREYATFRSSNLLAQFTHSGIRYLTQLALRPLLELGQPSIQLRQPPLIAGLVPWEGI